MVQLEPQPFKTKPQWLDHIKSFLLYDCAISFQLLVKGTITSFTVAYGWVELRLKHGPYFMDHSVWCKLASLSERAKNKYLKERHHKF